MDFIVSLPPVQGLSIVMVVMDLLSKFAHFITMKHDYNSQSIANSFISNIVKMHGMPCSTASGRDNIFMSHFW